MLVVFSVSQSRKKFRRERDAYLAFHGLKRELVRERERESERTT